MDTDICQAIDLYLAQNTLNPFIKAELKELSENILKSQKALGNEEYELVFIGKSGAGKTTVISSLFGLYFENDEGKIIQVMQSDTGGRTTPCTVEIIPSDINQLQVIPKNKQDVETILNEYALFQVQKNKPKTNSESEKNNSAVKKIDSKSNLSAEIRTVIKNNLSKEIRNELKNISDLDEVKRIIKKVVNFENLDTEDFILNSEFNNKNETFKWLNKKLDQIRKGKLGKLIIPNKIIIYINKNFITVPPQIKKIIDTRGISTDTINKNNTIAARKDLDEYINKDNAIVVYINEFTSVESAVLTFYETKLLSSKTQPEDLVKTMILVNAQNGSIESKVDDPEDEDEIEEFINEKKTEFSNAILANEEKFSASQENYTYIKEEILNNNGKIVNFFIYQPLCGMKKNENNGSTYFSIENENKVNANKILFVDEITELISIKNKINALCYNYNNWKQHIEHIFWITLIF